MSNRIFLFSLCGDNSDMLLAKEIFKAVFRKFRKTVYYNHFDYEITQSSAEGAFEAVEKEIEKSDAVTGGFGNIGKGNGKTIFEAVKPFARICYCGKKCIVSPAAEWETEENDEYVRTSRTLSKEKAEALVNAVIDSVEGKKSVIAVCESDDDIIGKELLETAERLCARKTNITLERICLEDIIWQCKSIEAFPDVLILGKNEEAAVAFMCSLKPSFGAYKKYVGENKSVYMPQKLPFSEITNIRLLCIASSCAAVIEKELSMGSAAIWLKRAAALAWEKCENHSEEEFMNELFARINDKMRKTSKNRGELK